MAKKVPTITHHVRGSGELPLRDGLQRHPLDRPVLVVAEAVVVVGEEVTRQRAVRQLQRRPLGQAVILNQF